MKIFTIVIGGMTNYQEFEYLIETCPEFEKAVDNFYIIKSEDYTGSLKVYFTAKNTKHDGMRDWFYLLDVVSSFNVGYVQHIGHVTWGI